MGFEGGGFERFGQALKAGLFEGEGRRVAHGGAFDKRKRLAKRSRWARGLKATFYLGEGASAPDNSSLLVKPI
jgi:hypothetical protein